MARLRFNKAVINGTTVSIEDFVNGTGEITKYGVDSQVVTLDHLVHNVRIQLLSRAKFIAWGDKTTMATQAVATDTNNFGGTHSFYYDTTLVDSFDGLVSCLFNPETRQTTIEIEGEAHVA